MKIIIKRVFTILISAYYKFRGCNFSSTKTTFFLSKIDVKKTNSLQLYNACIDRSSIIVEGISNQVVINGFISNTTVTVFGKNNQIRIHANVKLHNSTLVLRGDSCKIEIGCGSTFGKVYMVCMGKNNLIQVGENCMFAENIDIWATDSHPIYNNESELINHSKPVIIGDLVWVGAKCSILKGVNIGSGSIIGMSSIVTKNVAPKTLNVGNPIRCIKTNIHWDRQFIKS
jgi:acetyltransferase-like isoleucine patch superfamily enzyme